MRVRKRVLIICGLILLILYTARVIVVNKNADRVPVYIYDVGETVDFRNDYVDTVEECIDGYAVQVLGYEVVDTRELYERYNMGQADEATVKNTPFYCLLKVRIYNKDCDLGEEGGLMLDRYSLMGDNYMALVSENVFAQCTLICREHRFHLEREQAWNLSCLILLQGLRAVQKRICRKSTNAGNL